MHPILFHIGPVTVYSYGAMFAFGFAIAFLLIYKNASAYGLDRDSMTNLLFLTLVGGILGARTLYVALNLHYYMHRPLEIFNLSRGGLVWYGGFFGGILTFTIYSIVKELSFWKVSDFFVPYVALAQAVGRIGCFLNGCCYGIVAPSGYPIGVTFPGNCQVLHPTQIYSSLILLATFIVLRSWQDRKHFMGEIFLGYLLLYSAQRFLVEFFRGDNERILYNLTMSQVISVVVFILAGAMFKYKVYEWQRKSSVSK